MFEHVFTQLIRSFGIFFRTIRAFFTRRLVGLTARVRRLFNFSRNATKIAASSLQGAASLAKKPTRREDYIETSRLFISKSLLVGLAIGLVTLAVAVYFVIWPFILSHFLTARFYVEDRRVENWTGRVIVYRDKEKTIPLRSGRLTEGLLEGEGKEYDEAGLLCYEGAFRSGLRDGTGSAYVDGVLVYTGGYAEGLRSGEGKLYEGGKLSYEGQFQADAASGEGTSYYPNGQIAYRGQFADGVSEGQGTAYSRQGSRVYEGGFSQGVYSGQGRLYLSRSQRLDAAFAEGAPEGTVQWLKNGVLYYEGEWSGVQAEGFGRIYSQSGKVLYEGRVTGGTLDLPWLTELGLEDFRAALGEGKLQQEADSAAGGFTITSAALGLTARCRFQQEGAEAGVESVSLFQPQGEGKDWVELLPSRLTGSGIQRGEMAYAAAQGVPLWGGDYDGQTADSEDGAYRMLLLFDPAGAPVLYQCSRMGEETPLIPEEENTGMTEEEAGESRMDALLASLNMMGDAGAASADGGAAPSPFFGGGDVSGALAACADGKAGTELMDALLLYWENAERRSAAEANLERTRQLLEETRALGGETAGLEAEAAALESAIEDCTGEMGKASLTAQEAAGADPAAFDVADAAVMFDPSQLDVEDLALMTAAYVQGRGETVDTSAMALHLKTALVDLTTAYKGVQTALQGYEDAGTASRQAATAYAMETGSKTAWFSALSAKEDARAALVSAIAGFSRQANSLNGDSGGWIARNCGWFAGEFTQLFQQDSQDETREEETPKPLEDRLEEIIQGTLQDPEAGEEPGTEAGEDAEQPPEESEKPETDEPGADEKPEAGEKPATDETDKQLQDTEQPGETPKEQPEEGT